METLQKGYESEQSCSFAQSNAATEIAPTIPFQRLNYQTKGSNYFPYNLFLRWKKETLMLVFLNFTMMLCLCPTDKSLGTLVSSGSGRWLAESAARSVPSPTLNSHYWQSGIPNSFSYVSLYSLGRLVGTWAEFWRSLASRLASFLLFWRFWYYQIL